MLKTLCMAALILTAGVSYASAAEVIVKEKERPAVTIPVPGVEVEKRERVERRDVETTGRGGCETKSVTKEGVGKSKTVTKSNC